MRAKNRTDETHEPVSAEQDPLEIEARAAPRTAEPTRRSFLCQSTLTSAAVGAGLALAGSSQAVAADPGRGRHLPNLYPGENRNLLLEILQDEEDHVVVLGKLSDGFSGRKRPTFNNLVAPSAFDFIRTAAMIENGGVGSYLQGVNAISQGGHDEYLLIAAGITAVEAQHTGFLNALLNQPIAPSAQNNTLMPGVATPIPPSQIRDTILANNFIRSLNDYQDFFLNGYDVKQGDDANDQRIINFALVLEFLEVEFYRNNIVRFFRQL